MADQVATVINRNVSENWTIHRVASELYVSVSLLKKKLKEENTSYTRILLECRMKKASELIVMQEGRSRKWHISAGTVACRILSASSGNITDTRLQDAGLTEIYLKNNSKTVV